MTTLTGTAGGAGGNGGSATATAGDTIINFNNSSNAGTSTINNTLGGYTLSIGGGGGSGSVGEAGGNGGTVKARANNTIVNFNDSSSAGSATIHNAGNGVGQAGLGFDGGGDNGGSGGSVNADQGHSMINFNNNATAGTATIDNLDNVYFNQSATARNSVITNNGRVYFFDDSNAPNATIINNSGGVVYLNNHNAPGISIGSLSGAGNILLGGNNLTLGNLNKDDEISGVISDFHNGNPPKSGSLTKVGTGTLIFSGNNTYTGATNINNGTLQFDGTGNSQLITNRNGTFGTLSGIGRVGNSQAIVNNGVVSPGNAANPFGTLTTDGAFQNTSTGVFVTHFSDTESSSLTANTLDLQGGHVKALMTGGTFLDHDQYTYIILNGTRTGEFDANNPIDPGSQIPFYFVPSLQYNAADVQLVLTRTSQVFEGDNLTPNQQEVFREYRNNNLGQFESFLFAAQNLNGFGNALSQISGDALAAFPTAAQGRHTQFVEGLLSQALSGTSGGGSSQLALNNFSAPRLAFAGDVRRLMARGDSANAAKSTYTQGRGNGIWATLGYGSQNVDSDGNGPGFDASGTNLNLGWDRQSGDTLWGIGVGYSNGDVDVDNRAAHGDLKTYNIGLYGRRLMKSTYVAAQLSYSRHNINTNRNTGIGTATADYNAHTLGASGEFGKRGNENAKWRVQPNVNFNIALTNQGSFTESGPGGVAVNSDNFNSYRAGIGVRLTRNSGGTQPYLSLNYQHEFGDTRTSQSNSLAGLPAFQVKGADLGSNIFSARLGVRTDPAKRLQWLGEIGGSLRSNQTTFHLYGGARYSF